MKNTELGAWGAAISGASATIHSVADIEAMVYAAYKPSSEATFDLWNTAVDDANADMIKRIVAEAGLVPELLDLPAAPYIGPGISAVAGFASAASDFGEISQTEAGAGNTILKNSVTTASDAGDSINIRNPVFTANLVQSDGYVNLSGTPSVNQAGINMMLGSSPLSAVTDPNGNYRLFLPLGVPATDYGHGIEQLVDPTGGQALGTYTVDLSLTTANTQLPKIAAHNPSEPSGWTAQNCQSIQSGWDSLIESAVSGAQLYYSLGAPDIADILLADVATDISDELYLLNGAGCWTELDTVPHKSPPWP